jgi:hypothetical protein
VIPASYQAGDTVRRQQLGQAESDTKPPQAASHAAGVHSHYAFRLSLPRLRGARWVLRLYKSCHLHLLRVWRSAGEMQIHVQWRKLHPRGTGAASF